MAATCALAGCSYAFTYGGAEGSHAARHDVRVEPLSDATGEGSLAALVTDRLRARLGAPRGDRATLVLTGEVTSIEVTNLPVARPGGVAAGLAVVRVRGVVRVRDLAGRSVLDGAQREGTAEMVVGRSVSETEDQRRLAVERAAAALADELADAVTARP